MQTLSAKEWFLFGLSVLLIGIAVGLSISGTRGNLHIYVFLAGSALQIITLCLLFRHRQS